MICYVINLSAWIVFIELPVRIIAVALRLLCNLAVGLAHVCEWLRPNDPRGNNG